MRVSSAIGPNGRLVTASEKLPPSLNETVHLDQLADIGFDGLVTGRVGAHVGLGVAVDPDPLVGPGEGAGKLPPDEIGSPFPSAMPSVSANRMPAPSAEARTTGRPVAFWFTGVWACTTQGMSTRTAQWPPVR